MCAVHVLTIQHMDLKGTPVHMYMCMFSDGKEACDTCINYIYCVSSMHESDLFMHAWNVPSCCEVVAIRGNMPLNWNCQSPHAPSLWYNSCRLAESQEMMKRKDMIVSEHECSLLCNTKCNMCACVWLSYLATISFSHIGGESHSSVHLIQYVQCMSVLSCNDCLAFSLPHHWNHMEHNRK